MQSDFDRFALTPPPDPVPHGPSRYLLPRGAVDTHAHIVGEGLVDDRSYTPPPATGAEYLHMLDATGMTYGVLVQVSVHGTNNAAMLDVLRAQPRRLRGVAVVAPDASDAALADLAAAGVVGLRMNTLTGGGIGMDNLDRYEAICKEMGWHIQFLTTTRHLGPVASQLAKLDVPYVIDHMGDPDVTAGLHDTGWQLMRELVADGAWTKLSGAFRITKKGPPYSDTISYAQSLVEIAPHRCIWGSDWPQVGFFGPMPNVGELLDLLADWVPDEKTRNAVLTTNAHRLYGFDATSTETR